MAIFLIVIGISQPESQNSEKIVGCFLEPDKFGRKVSVEFPLKASTGENSKTLRFVQRRRGEKNSADQKCCRWSVAFFLLFEQTFLTTERQFVN